MRRTLLKAMAILAIAGLAPVVAPVAWADDAKISVPVTVAEPIGVARAAFPASGGIPFKPGQVKDVADLTLLDAAGKSVPAQFSKLAGYEDGSVQWALCDVLVDAPAGGEAKYTIAGGMATAPASPLKISETADAVTLDTGAVELVVGKRDFNLFDSVKVAGRPVVVGGEAGVTGGKGRWYVQDRKTKQWEEKVDASHEGKEYSAGAPTRVNWEYRGPLRATLRIDGDYLSADGKERWLSYTARITAWAGSGLVRVAFSVRNSNPAEGNDAFITRAPLTLKLSANLAGQGSGADFAAGGDGQVGLLVQNRHTAGTYAGPATYLISKFSSVGYHDTQKWTPLYGQKVDGQSAYVEIVSPGPRQGKEGKPNNGDHGFTCDGVFALADRAHKESEVWFDFYSGPRDAAANAARAKAVRSKLLVVAPGEWYSETQAMGIGHFGTLADEVATYRKWGWKGADDSSKWPKDPHEPYAFVPAEMMHNTTEDDSVQSYLLQFLRTGQRGCFDWGEAYCGFYRGQSICRSDWGSRWGVAGPTGKRENKGQGFDWYGPHVFEWADTRMHGCHHYGRGIFDYYCLTGDTDALEAGLDLADEVTAGSADFKPGYFSFGREFGREFLTALRAWQVTRDPKWKKVCDAYAGQILGGKNWAPELGVYHQSLGIKNSYFARPWTKGHFDVASNPSWAKILEREKPLPAKLEKYLADNQLTAYYDRGKVMARKGEGKDAPTWEVTYLTQVFELSPCHLAMDRYAAFFDSAPMRQRLIEVTEGVARNYWSPVVEYMIGSPWFGWPDKDKTLDPYAWMDSTEGIAISGYATRYTADMFARAYEFSRDPKLLELAKRSWDRGSKRGYETRAPSAGPDEVGGFAYTYGCKNDTILECSARLFYVVTHEK
ncbi:MAG: hypothetical protein BIFFINMI_00368 [Phycisphaerae bacterium]|nr:hypothetical protein [Phycisphaerae bacterium]